MISTMRDLESWRDEDGAALDESCYQELSDPANQNGWSADEMFRFNEKMLKITSSYDEKTLINLYTTSLPQNNSKYSIKLASKLAKEIEDRVLAEGRITPESSDDDEKFENERRQKRSSTNQKKQLNNSLNKLEEFVHDKVPSNNKDSSTSHDHSKILSTQRSCQTFACPIKNNPTENLSTKMMIKEVMKPGASSSRNILRTCLIKGSNICV